MTRWPTATIGSACTVFSGGTPSKANAAYWRGSIPWVSAKDLKSDRIFDAELHISQQACDESAAKMAPVGSLLMLVRGMGLANGIQIGEVTAPVAFNQDLRAIVPPPEVESRFLLLALRHRLADGGKGVLSSAAHGTLKIDADALRQVEFPVPAREEQRRIVAILDEAFEGIATAKANAAKNLQSARELFTSHLDGALSHAAPDCVSTSLGAEIDLLAGYAFSSDSYTANASSVRLLRGDNIMQGYLRWDDAKKWPIEDRAQYARFELQAGDVVLAMDRPWVKAGLKRAQIAIDDLPCLLVQRTARLRPRGSLTRAFLFHLTGSLAFSQHLLRVQTGIGVPHISGKQIESFQFMRPTVANQERIAAELDEVQTETELLAKIYERKLAALDELKHSLLHQAFTGGLSPQNDRPPHGHDLPLCTQ